MRRLKVVFLPSARADFDRTSAFLRRIGTPRSVARTYVARLRRHCTKLGDAPYIGTAREELGPGLRTAGFERRATIVFRVLPDRLQIVNVFYGDGTWRASTAARVRSRTPAEPPRYTVTCAPNSTTRPTGMRKKSVGLAALRSRKM